MCVILVGECRTLKSSIRCEMVASKQHQTNNYQAITAALWQCVCNYLRFTWIFYTSCRELV